MGSKKTTVVPVRLPNEVVDVIDRRVKVTGKYRTRSGYLRDRIIYDTMRKHKRRRGK